jgi:hypothetical protein
MPVELFLPISLLCSALVFLQYYRNRRLIGGFGWALTILAIGGFGSGLAESFAWSGLVFSFIGGMGVIAILQDLIFLRQARHRRESPATIDLDREA